MTCFVYSLNKLADPDVDGETCVRDGAYDNEGELISVFDDDGLEMGDITV